MDLVYKQTSLDDVVDLMARMENAVKGVDAHSVQIAAIALATILQDPKINADKLNEIVKGASEFIALSLFETPNGRAN